MEVYGQAMNKPEQLRKETELENMVNRLEKLNSESQSLTSRLESLSDKLRNEPVPTDPNEGMKEPAHSGLISRLNSLLNDYQKTIGRNQQSVGRLESII